MKNCHLVKHVSLELETVARPHMLQQVEDLLPATVLLTKIQFQFWEIYFYLFYLFLSA